MHTHYSIRIRGIVRNVQIRLKRLAPAGRAEGVSS